MWTCAWPERGPFWGERVSGALYSLHPLKAYGVSSYVRQALVPCVERIACSLPRHNAAVQLQVDQSCSFKQGLHRHSSVEDSATNSYCSAQWLGHCKNTTVLHAQGAPRAQLVLRYVPCTSVPASPLDQLCWLHSTCRGRLGAFRGLVSLSLHSVFPPCWYFQQQ